MVSVTMATSEWIQFFKEAGIPPGPAVNYAVMFVDNRIQKNMLLDLNKEIMNELGITIVGDIIAILKHAKVVYRQEMCKAATEALSPPSAPAELRRNASSAASRMIANSLSHDSPPATPTCRRDTSKISVTVSNKLAVKSAGLREAETGSPAPVQAKQRRVTAEMEGKYVITMPKGTTPRTKKILEQQAAKGLQRTSVFDRLGAETKADTAAGKPTGVFSRLGNTPAGNKNVESDDDEGSVLPYAGVLKKAPKDAPETGKIIKAKAQTSEPPRRRAGGKIQPPQSSLEAQDSSVSSSRSKNQPEFRVTIKRTWGSAKVSSSSDALSTRMDNTGTVSVFQRLGKKAD